MKRVLITGGSSYLGQHLVPAAADGHDICYTTFQNDPLALTGARALDIRDRVAVLSLVDDFRPEAIIHTAGSNRSPDMERVIRVGTAHVVEAAGRCQARLIHISSDVVFDGRQGPYDESTRPNPQHAYGRAKAEAEALVAGHLDHVIVRTSLIYGLEIMDRSTEWIAGALRDGQTVTLFGDQWRNPIWAESLSQACLELIGSSYRGILHVAGEQAMTRADFGLKLLDWWGVEARIGLQIGPSDDRWPRDCRLDSSLANRILASKLPGVDEVLALHQNAPGPA